MVIQQKATNKPAGINKPEQKIRYGCVFCLTGHEESVTESLEAQNPGLFATHVSQVKLHTVKGISNKVIKRILPGYVYFKTKSGNPPDLRYIQNAVRLLRPSSGNWALWGMDEWFAGWIFENHGVIGMSKARINAENRVEVVSGPLKTLENYIERVIRRDHCGQVALPFHDREVRIWLLYELVE
jgi:transcription antitermination factor NusG